jgi:hypothetical protein
VLFSIQQGKPAARPQQFCGLGNLTSGSTQ